MRVWITRDEQDVIGVFGGRSRPRLIEDSLGYEEWSDGYSRESHSLFLMGLKYFVKFFGFTPKRLLCKQYEMPLKEIK
jgi:hypothetical protein